MEIPKTIKEFLRPRFAYEVIEHKWGTFTILGFIVYSFHFVMCIGGVDKFTDITRKNICGNATNEDDASAIFDTALALASIFHMIEWIRQAIFLTSSLIGANLIGFYYALSINIPFGVVAMLYAIIVRNSKNGSECAEVGL